jgi:hypothetical protein
MRITHYEMMKLIIGEQQFIRLTELFQIIKDDQINAISKSYFDSLFSASFCSTIFGGSEHLRAIDKQRKMDLAVIYQFYHIWKDKVFFDITENLCSNLKETDLKDVDTFFLQTPYRSIYFSLPPKNGLMIPDSSKGLNEISGIYITLENFKEPINFTTPKGNNFNGVTKMLHMVVCGEVDQKTGDSILFFDLFFFEGKINNSLEINKKYFDNIALWDSILNTFNFILKLLIYINCTNNSIKKVAGLDIKAKIDNLKNPAKKRKLFNKYCKYTTHEHFLLDIIIKQQDTPNSEHKPSLHLNKKLEKIRAHFKIQHYDKDLSKSKVIWIESYIRGEGAEFYRQTNKTYKVK